MFSQLSADDVAKLFEKEARNAHEAIRNETRSRENAFRNAFVLAVNKSGEQYSITAVRKLPSSSLILDADVLGCSRKPLQSNRREQREQM